MSNYFYEDDNKTIKPSLLTDQARDWAKKFLHPQRPENKGEKNTPLTSAQLRKYYREVKSLEMKVKAKGFTQIKPLIKMLKSKTAYACPKTGKDRKIPEEFKDYISTCVDKIEDQKDFKAFVLFFEATVGYFYGEGGR